MHCADRQPRRMRPLLQTNVGAVGSAENTPPVSLGHRQPTEQQATGGLPPALLCAIGGAAGVSPLASDVTGSEEARPKPAATSLTGMVTLSDAQGVYAVNYVAETVRRPPLTRAYAHSGTMADRSDWQTLEDHHDQVSKMATDRGQIMGLGIAAGVAGAFHDFGKNDPDFQKVLAGQRLRVDHSTAGGMLLMSRATARDRFAAEILAHAILGHHAGLPDSTGPASVSMRRDGFVDRVPPEVAQRTVVDLLPAARELVAKCRADSVAFDLALAGRMVFSCLVDADRRDTAAFYGEGGDRDWPVLADLLPSWRMAFDAYVAALPQGELAPLRNQILGHVRAGASLSPGLFTLTVPTGGGKTLASLGFALDHAALHGHRRVIYAIPYTSIIDQTASTFRTIFGEGVLEHHSAIDQLSPGAEGREKLKLAMEDWAAPLVVTTNVQLFESLFAARPSACRKLHNIAGSVIVLDEAQCLPRGLLAPTLRMIEALAAQYGCTVVLCTATQPAFDSCELDRGRKERMGLKLADRELAPDPEVLAGRLRRARIVSGGEMSDATLREALQANPQGMVIVNTRAHALQLYQAIKDLPGALHLTTRQCPAHRRQILARIRDQLRKGAPCRLIATSLVEAGVDLDFPKAWRAEAGLDSVIQAAGRVNREGRNSLEHSTLTLFEAPDHPPPNGIKPLVASMRKTLAQFGPEELASPEAIRHWFEDVYWRAGVLLDEHSIVTAFMTDRNHCPDFAYRTVAELYRMVESPMLPVIIPCEDASHALSQLMDPGVSSGGLARDLQPFVVQIPAFWREKMRANGKGDFAAKNLRGDQFFVLTQPDLYREDTGLHWEGAEDLTEEQWNI